MLNIQNIDKPQIKERKVYHSFSKSFSPSLLPLSGKRTLVALAGKILKFEVSRLLQNASLNFESLEKGCNTVNN